MASPIGIGRGRGTVEIAAGDSDSAPRHVKPRALTGLRLLLRLKTAMQVELHYHGHTERAVTMTKTSILLRSVL